MIESCLDTLTGTTYISNVDMAAGYWQIEIDPRDCQKSAFITKYGIYEHVRIPFGICNSPATFSRVMQLVLQGLACLAYLDDVIILGHNFQDHIQKLKHVFERFKTYNLKLEPAKCNLLKKKVKS